jgi:hypothetical protein
MMASIYEYNNNNNNNNRAGKNNSSPNIPQIIFYVTQVV